MLGAGEKRQYSLRTLFAAVTICAVVIAVCSGTAAFIQREWMEPGREGEVAWERFQALFAKRGWQGHAAPYFYDHRVEIRSASIGDKELPELYPILDDLPWLRHIELYETTVTSKGLADLQRRYPACHISTDDRP